VGQEFGKGLIKIAWFWGRVVCLFLFLCLFFKKGEGGGWGNQVMGIKEGMCCDEHWVLYTTNESLNTTSKT